MINKFKNIKVENIMNIVLAICFVIGFDYYFFQGDNLGKHSVFNFILLFFNILLFNTKKTKDDKKNVFIFSFMFSLFLLIGQKIYIYNDISAFKSFKTIILLIISLCGFTKTFGEIIAIMLSKIKGINKSKLWKFYNHKYVFIILWFVIFVSWVPAFLAYYPGILSYDSLSQTNQIFSGVYLSAHPPIHTFIWEICLKLGGMHSKNALVIYSIIQMLFLSFVCARMIKYLIDKKVNNYIILISILFVTINPVIAIFSMSMTKDVYFTAFFVLFILELLEFIKDPSKYCDSKFKILLFIIIALVMCLFRSNAIYVLILTCIGVIIGLKKYYKKVMFLFFIPIIFCYLITNGLYNYLGFVKGGSCEMLSIPIQQISYVIYKHDDEIPKKMKKEISNFLGYYLVSDSYNPRFADPMKGTFKNQYYDANKQEFYKIYFNLFKQYPTNYVSAFLSLNLPYWYIDADVIDKYSKRKYIETDMRIGDNYKIKRESKIPSLLKIYKSVEDYSLFEKIPFVSLLFSLSFPIWFIIFTLCEFLNARRYKLILVLLPMIFLWLTYIAGPVSIFRYVLPLFVLYPLILSLTLNYKNFE